MGLENGYIMLIFETFNNEIVFIINVAIDLNKIVWNYSIGWFSYGRQYIESLGGVVARVAAAWAAAAFRVAGALHRVSWRSCGVRGRLLDRR